MRNSEFGIRNEENCFVVRGTNSYCTVAEFTPEVLGRSAEFGMVLTQVRNAEFGVRNDKLEYCSGRAETAHTAQCRILPPEALGGFES